MQRSGDPQIESLVGFADFPPGALEIWSHQDSVPDSASHWLTLMVPGCIAFSQQYQTTTKPGI